MTALNRFGTWQDALVAAGVTVTHGRNIKKEQVIEALRAWFEKNNCEVSCLEYWSIRKAKDRGQFPYSTQTVSSRFDNKPWETIMKECGYSYVTVDQYFKRGFFTGEDEIVYLSSIEKQIGDFLFKLKKEGKIKDYEYEKKVCSDRYWTCDFFIDRGGREIWLEVDGMLNNRRFPYLSGKNEKIEYYKDNEFNYFILSYRTPDVERAILKIIQGESF
jgi:hypothetical protein